MAVGCTAGYSIFELALPEIRDELCKLLLGERLAPKRPVVRGARPPPAPTRFIAVPPRAMVQVELVPLDHGVCVHLYAGFPCSITHVIDQKSPLFGLSLEEMQERRVEIIALIEGIDPGTSHVTRATNTYKIEDFLVNRVFSG